MIKKERYIGLKLDTDTAADKRERDTLFANYGFEVTNNKGLLSLSRLKESKAITNDMFSNLIGWVEVIDTLYLFTRVSEEQVIIASVVEGSMNVTTVATLAIAYPEDAFLDIIANKENTNIIKLYWAHESNQLCSINLLDIASPTTPYDPALITAYELTAPTVAIVDGGSLIAGRIQYGYTLFGLHETETAISPLSRLLSVSRDMEGGESAEVLDISAEVTINPTATDRYTHMRVFSIHYQELNQLPKITLIYEAVIGEITLIDDGNLFISEYGIDQFLNLGGTFIKPKTIAAKNNRLFAANFSASSFEVPFAIDTDTRCYAFEEGTEEFCIYNKGETVGCRTLEKAETDLPVPETHDAIKSPNTLLDYVHNSSIRGVEGVNFKITFNANSTAIDRGKPSLKQGETYRIGLVWYDKYMRVTPVSWMADILVPYYSSQSVVISLIVTFKGDPGSLDTNYGIKGYRLARVQRLPKDRTISSPGLILPTVNYGTYWGMPSIGDGLYPYYIMKRMLNDITDAGSVYTPYVGGEDFSSPTDETAQLVPELNTDKVVMYSSDTIFEEGKLEIYDNVLIRNYYTGSIVNDSDTLLKRYSNGELNWEENSSGILYNGGPVGSEILIYDSTHSEIAEEMAHFYRFTTIHTAAESKTVALSDIKGLDRKSSDTITTPLGTKTVNSSFSYPVEVQSGATSLMQNEFERCYALGLPQYWHRVGGLEGAGDDDNFNAFSAASNIGAQDHGIPIVELTRTLPNQYNGNTYEQRQLNTYMLLGDAVALDPAANTYYIGDVTVGPLIINRMDGLDRRAPHNWNVYDYIEIAYLEHNVDVYSRYDKLYDWFEGTYPDFISTYRLKDNRLLLPAYNQEDKLITALAKPITFDSVTEFGASIIASEVKFPNEVIDSWTEFLPNEVMNLQGMYGPINKLYNFKNEIISFQTTAVASIAIQPRVQIQTDDAIGVELGTGAILYDYTYLVTKSGTIAMRSITDDSHTLFYYDHLTNTINSLDGNEVTVALKVDNLMTEHEPIDKENVQGIYINDRREFLFTLEDKTLVYSSALGGFQRTDFGEVADTQILFKGKAHFFSPDTEDTSPIVERYAEVSSLQNQQLTYIFAPDPTNDKVFHNLEFRYQGLFTINNVLATMINEGVDANDASPKIADKFGIGRYHLPRLDGTRERLRTTSIRVSLNFDAGEEDLKIHDMVIMYNIKG